LAEIDLEEVTKTFGGNVVAVHDVSLRIEDGEFLVLVFFDAESGTNMQRAKRPDELESRRFESAASAARK
jgi:hypothetical protein